MNRDICDKCSKPIELCDCPTGTTYDLLRRQHEAIKVLREALQECVNVLPAMYYAHRDAQKALKDTEGLI